MAVGKHMLTKMLGDRAGGNCTAAQGLNKLLPSSWGETRQTELLPSKSLGPQSAFSGCTSALFATQQGEETGS